jgi:hypothetical protein
MKKYTNKFQLILERGARCQFCKASKFKGESIVTDLVMTRKDRMNPEYTDENALLICRACYYASGLNKRRTKKEMESLRKGNENNHEARIKTKAA